MEECLVGDGLSVSLLRVLDDVDNVDWLREILSGFSHRCRNSLNGMKLGFYLCKRESPGALPSVWHELEQTYELIERTLDRLQLIYRPLNLTMVESKLGSMIAEHEASWKACFAAHGKELVVNRPLSERLGRFDPMYLGQGLDAFVAWRAEATPVKSRVKLGWCARADRLGIHWNEESSDLLDARDASNAPEVEDPQTFFQRQADSLALPLLVRIVRAHDGRMFHAHDSNRSLRIEWPRACLAMSKD